MSLYSPLEEVAPSSVGVDGGESLKTAGDVRGEWWLADVFQALQLTNQNPKNGEKNVLEFKEFIISVKHMIEDD